MAVFTTWFDQPMYINGNTSRPVLLARPGELESAAMLRCAGATWSATKGRYFFSDTSPPLIVLPSGLNQRSKSPAQLRLEHRRMLNVFRRHHRWHGRRSRLTASAAKTSTGHVLDAASRRIGGFLEGQIGIEWSHEPNVVRSMLLPACCSTRATTFAAKTYLWPCVP